eukprot:COSAG05_NODE_142_length_16591_cov_6.726837_14_plen_70_part_00
MWQMYRSGHAESIIGASFNVFNDKVIVTTNNTRLVTLFDSSGSYCAVGSCDVAQSLSPNHSCGSCLWGS